MRRRTRVTIVSTRKLILYVYVIPFLVIVSLFIMFLIWAFTPSSATYVRLVKTAQVKYNLSPYSNSHATLDRNIQCRLMDTSVHHIDGDPTDYYYVNCNNRVGYVGKSNLSW
jgi:hypothetical protein